MGGLPCDWDKGLFGLHQLECELFGRHGAARTAAATWAALANLAALSDAAAWAD